MKKIINAIICVALITLIFCSCGTTKKSSSAAAPKVSTSSGSASNTAQTNTNTVDTQTESKQGNGTSEQSKTVSVSKENTLSNSKIRSLTIKADEAISKAFSCNNVDYKNPIEKGGQDSMEYGRSLNYTSRKQIRNDLSKYFDGNNLDKFIDNMTLVQNNKLYILIGQEGMRPDLRTANMKVKRQQGAIQVDFTDGSDDGKVSEDKTLVYENNRWVFKNLWYTN